MTTSTNAPFERNVIFWIGLCFIALLAALPLHHTVSIVFFGERSLVGETLAVILALEGLAFALFAWVETPLPKRNYS